MVLRCPPIPYPASASRRENPQSGDSGKQAIALWIAAEIGGCRRDPALVAPCLLSLTSVRQGVCIVRDVPFAVPSQARVARSLEYSRRRRAGGREDQRRRGSQGEPARFWRVVAEA